MSDAGSDPLAGIAATLVQSPAQELARADTLVADGPRPATASPAPTSRYRQLEVLGHGGMGRVDRVLDRDLLREVAVKHLHEGIADDPVLFEQFVWEARVTARLDHPNIVPLHDFAAGRGGRLFFTMKLVRGRTLDELIRDTGRKNDASDLHARLRLFLAVCQAVAFAHERGVLHRDLKPGNVMIGDFGEVLVSDWGLALPLPDARGDELRAAAPAGLARASVGTPAYMSPEQARGAPLDARSDVWALGTILYELVALRPAFEGPTAPAILAAVVGGDAPPLATVRSDVPGSVVSIVSRAMALDRDERYPEVRDLVEDIEAVIEGRTPEAEHASIPRRLARYYVTRDPAMRGLRVVDIDMWMAASMAIGIGIGALLSSRFKGPWWLAFVVGLVSGAPTTWRWLSLRRTTQRS